MVPEVDMSKFGLCLAVAILLAVPCVPRIQAQAKGNDTTKSELRNFDGYLDKHPDVRADLERNPKLIDDPGYLSKHPHLKTFLEHHPNTREELRENPQAFMHRENRYDKKEDKKEDRKEKKMK
jgi:hypothetical protein